MKIAIAIVLAALVIPGAVTPKQACAQGACPRAQFLCCKPEGPCGCCLEPIERMGR
jgi:hypothetical protein